MKILKIEGGFEEFIDPVAELFKKAKMFVDMSTTLYPEFYNNEKIKKSIKKSIEKVAEMRILLDKDADVNQLKRDVKWLFDERKKFPGKIKIAKARTNVEHRIIVDGRHIRIEGEHKNFKKIRNLIVFDAEVELILPFMREFEKWWRESEEVA